MHRNASQIGVRFGIGLCPQYVDAVADGRGVFFLSPPPPSTAHPLKCQCAKRLNQELSFYASLAHFLCLHPHLRDAPVGFSLS